MNSNKLRMRLLLAGCSALLAGLIGAWWLQYARRSRVPGDTVELVDTSERKRALLESRANSATGAAPGLGPASGGAAAGLEHLRLDPEAARIYFPAIGGTTQAYDELMYARRAGGQKVWQAFPEHPAGGWWVCTNDLGMREDEEPAASRPDLRILVTGDSHTDGVCPNSESFANQLEALLRQRRPGLEIEVLNAGCGGYCSYNYLGVLEAYARRLQPDLFVVVVYGGNDFAETLELERYFDARPPARFDRRPPKQVLQEAQANSGIVAQELSQIVYLVNNIEEFDLCRRTQEDISDRMQRLAAENGIELLCVYLPPASRTQPAYYAEVTQRAMRALDLGPQDLALSDRIADGWLEFLERERIAHLDLRPVLEAATEPMYWVSDHHLDVKGHSLVARALLPMVDALVPPR